jgi:hypothetical protein
MKSLDLTASAKDIGVPMFQLYPKITILLKKTKYVSFIKMLIWRLIELIGKNDVYLTVMKFKILLLIILGAHLSEAQKGVFIYDDYLYVDYISTITFGHTGLEASIPVIDINSRYQGQLKLGFDDMQGGYKTYIYRIIHCDKDWYPSQLNEIEYMEGFNYEEIDEFSYSTNGYSDYTHYNLYLPNDDLEWIISGNYLLVIYDEELELPVITRRFMVAESIVSVGYDIMKPRNVSKLNTHQELEITINHKNLHISRPTTELYVTVVQNGNWNSALRNLQGNYNIGDKLFLQNYDYIVFPALKEFRNFDLRSLKYTTEFVHSIDQDSEGTTVLLDLGKKRYSRNFVSERDNNGFFIIDNADYGDAENSSEYAKVIFTLESNKKYDEDVYIVGAFSDWQAREQYRMEYDEVRQLYVGAAYFKQGRYDYMFALQQDNGFLDIDYLEGSWYETENDYLILVYYREFGSQYDRIIGVANFNSYPRN